MRVGWVLVVMGFGGGGGGGGVMDLSLSCALRVHPPTVASCPCSALLEAYGYTPHPHTRYILERT